MLLDGKETAKQVKIELKEKIKVLKETYNKVPTIAIVLVGNNPGEKLKKAEKLGIKCLSVEDFLKLIEYEK